MEKTNNKRKDEFADDPKPHNVDHPTNNDHEKQTVLEFDDVFKFLNKSILNYNHSFYYNQVLHNLR